MEHLRLEGVRVAHAEYGLRAHCLGVLDGALGDTGLLVQRVRVLVAGTGHLRGHWLIMENIFVGATLNYRCTAWLLVEGI